MKTKTNSQALAEILIRHACEDGDTSWMAEDELLALEASLQYYIGEHYSRLSRGDRRAIERAIDGVNESIDLL